MKRNARAGGQSPISEPYKKPRRDVIDVDKPNSSLEEEASKVPITDPRKPLHGNENKSSLSQEEDRFDRAVSNGAKRLAPKSRSKPSIKRSGPTPPWELETATFNPRCKHCNRRWLKEQQEITLEADSSSLDTTEEFE